MADELDAEHRAEVRALIEGKGRWQLLPDDCALVFQGNSQSKHDRRHAGYWIQLDEVLTSSQMLDWIFQIGRKSWGRGAAVAELIEAFQLTLNPQGTLCSCGASKQLTAEQVRALIKKLAKLGEPLV